MTCPFFTVPLTRVLSAALLVAGTCVGGGMLALPVFTAIAGFWPSIFILFLCWVAMSATGLMLVEVSLSFEQEVHLTSMSRALLGRYGVYVSWAMYLFISYASLVAYTAGGGALCKEFFLAFDWQISKEWGCVLFCATFGIIAVSGSRLVGRANAFLFIAAVVTYFVLVTFSLGGIDLSLLERSSWREAPLAIPVLLAPFSFQTMVPSLTPYLSRDRTALHCSILLGTSIAFICYILWQVIVLGTVPLQGEGSLLFAMKEGLPATEPLKAWVGHRLIGHLAEVFAFFALVTSFFGIALGLFDFLADGLQIKKEGFGKLSLAVLMLVPTLYFALFNEEAFLVALDTSAGFGDSILNGIFPVLMLWIVGKRVFYFQKPFLLAVLSFYLLSLGTEILVHSGQVLSIYDKRRAIALESFNADETHIGE
ncbi:MAG: tyrP 3 [Chlamydiales bacterium]|jgi:tyrosine-specific transport protein|nr:tyrP 3 [Chlamydiales bacterium]